MRRTWLATALAALAAGTVVTTPAVAGAAPGDNELVSISTAGVQGNDITGRFAGPAIDADGSVVAFDSIARTLVLNDTNGEADVFVRDRAADTTERVSISTAGNQGNDDSTRPDIDGSGNLVVFDSSATNLAGQDTNNSIDVFLRDRAAAATTRVSVSSDEVPGDEQSHSPSISSDGRFVAFVSLAANLVPDDTNGVDDVFVRDLVAGTTELVSVASDGQQGNNSTTGAAISADGRFVAFSSFASNFAPGDTDLTVDVFVHDRQTGLTEIVSVSSDEAFANGTSAGPSVSADGQLVTFWSEATNVVPNDTNDSRDVFVRNRATGTTERVSVSSEEQQADGTSEEPGVRGFLASRPEITPDGRLVIFFASATNLVPDDTNTCPLFFSTPGTCPDVFVRDLVNGTTTRVNVAADGTQANDRSADPAISDDGSSVAFFSAANNLVTGDTNQCPLFTQFPGNCPDIFVHELGAGPGPDGADLAVTQTDAPDPATVGRPLLYTITVANNGPDAATAVAVVDQVPPGTSVMSARTSAGSCTIAGNQVECMVDTLVPGQQVSIKVRVRPMEVGRVRNVVTVSASQDDPNPADNTATERTRVLSA